MADQEKDSNKEVQPVESGQGLSPFADLDRWFEDFPRFAAMQPFGQGWFDWPDLEAPFRGRTPKVDMLDRDDAIVVRAELPGVDKDGLEVTVDENTVTIRATTRQEKKQEKENYYRREMSRGEFRRSLPLPESVDSEQAKARFKDGILELTLPKVAKTERKTIKVE